ncbi:MAG: histidine phosphatase family protein [Pseudomonadota bacterium]
MKIIFSRHGNTFAPGETTVWVGARQDLPLVDSGIQQAKNLARIIQQTSITLKAIYCGPLKRTSDYAKIVVDELHSSLKPIIDSRLNEIDYGNWSGLSSLEIQKKGGRDELAAWENFSQWPKDAGWLSSADLISNEVSSFADDAIKKYLPTDNILVIASNGRLRYFLQLIPEAFEQHIQNKNFKVSTGNLCLFVYKNKKWQVKFWDKRPEQLL